tara:strand:- start:55 stop:3183 length:3129 start_codon:yes stop_codon:yes gene_type:complete
MADTTRNVFSLSDWRSQQVDGEGIDASTVSLRQGGGGPRTAPNVGYFIGGNRSPGGNNNSYVDKIDLSSMTVSASNPAIIYAKGIAGKSIGNATHLFYTSGEPNSVSIRDYATDTSFRMGDQSDLASGHSMGGAASEGTTFGYYVAGNGPTLYGNGPGTNNSYVTKMNYIHGTSFDVPATTISTTPSPANGRNYIASASNKQAAYFIGGYPAGPNQPAANQYPSRRIDKITFSNDTSSYIPATTTPSPSGGSWYAVAIGEGTKIYYSGGYKGQTPSTPGDTYNTSTYKLTLATDSRDSVPGAPLPERARYQATTGSSTIGHFAGGNNGPTLSWIQRLTYATDTFVHSPARLGRSGEYMGGGSAYENGLSDEKPLGGFDNWLDPAPVATDPSYRPSFAGGGYPQYGWFVGIPGQNSGQMINFTSGTTQPAAQGPGGGWANGSGTNNETHGYLFGGTVNPGPGQRHTQVYKITFATGEYNAGEIQTISPTQYIGLPTPSTVASNISALSNPSKKGYYMGGYTPANNSKWVTMDYASDTLEGTPSSYRNPSTPSQPQLTGSATFSKRDASGYAFAGSNYYKMDFATDSTSMKSKSAGGGGNTSAGGASNLQGTAGYWTGSSDTNFYKLEFATDTISTVGAQANGNAAAMLTGIRGAWFWPQSNSITQRINFSTETVDTTGYGSPSPRSYAPMSPFNSHSKATNSVPPETPGTPGYAIRQSTGYPDKGYVGTGEGTGPGAAVGSHQDKFTFSTETNNSIPGAAAGGRKGVCGNTSPTAGYFSGGAYGPSNWGQARTTDRIPFSNDTPSIVPSATLPDPGKNWYSGSYGNREYGYRVKGQNYDPSYWSSTNDKITYATNTFERLSEGAGVYAGRAISTLASLEEGYAAGGGTPGQSSYMEKFTYQTASASLQPNSFLSTPLNQAGASGTNEKGYIFAGNTPSGNINSITKFTYRTGTLEATPAQIPGGLTPGPNRLTRAGAMSTGEYTYVMGGIVDDWQSNYYKFTHSTDTAQVISPNLSRGRGYLESTTASGQGENITYYKEQTNF